MKHKLVAVGGGLQAVRVAWGLCTDIKKSYEDRFMYTATIAVEDYTYVPVLRWIQDQIKSRSVQLVSDDQKTYVQYAGTRAAKIKINGETLYVNIEKDEAPASHQEFSFKSRGRSVIRFTARTARAIEVLRERVREVADEYLKEVRETRLFYATTFGWNAKSLPERRLDSIVLPGNDKSDLVNDLENFMNMEERFLKIGAPWHRGYLLYGPPGNGKTSLVLSIANSLGKHVYSLNLSSVKGDSELVDLVAEIKEGSILLIEDVDVFKNAVSREGNENGPTLAGLLNCLDGTHTPHGLITFMTSNNIEKLDPALVRNGRIDYRLLLSPPGPDEIRQMYTNVYGKECNGPVGDYTSMAEVVDVFKRHIDSPDSAIIELRRKDGRLANNTHLQPTSTPR